MVVSVFLANSTISWLSLNTFLITPATIMVLSDLSTIPVFSRLLLFSFKYPEAFLQDVAISSIAGPINGIFRVRLDMLSIQLDDLSISLNFLSINTAFLYRSSVAYKLSVRCAAMLLNARS